MRLPVLGIFLVSLFQGLECRGQWTYSETNWSRKALKVELWEALEERYIGAGITNLAADVEEPGWFSSRRWIFDFDEVLKLLAETYYLDLTTVSNNTIEAWAAANPSSVNTPPLWGWSNLLVHVGATNKPKASDGSPQFSNYTTNGSIRWVGASDYRFYQERKAVLNELLIAVPQGYLISVATNYTRGGVGSDTNLATAQAQADSAFSSDTNLPWYGGGYEVVSLFDNDLGNWDTSSRRSGFKVEVAHPEATTQFASRVIVYAQENLGLSTGAYVQFSANGLGFDPGSGGNPVYTNDYTAGGATLYTSGWVVADDTTPPEWWSGTADTNVPSANHIRGFDYSLKFAAFDYSVSNGFNYR
jgi:hypothetical protein